MTKNLLKIFLLITLFVPIYSYSTDKEENELQLTSEMLNKQLPKMIDKITQLYSTTALGDTLTYYNRIISHEKSDLNVDDFKKIMKEQISNSFCTNPATKYFRDNDLKWKHVYSDKNDVFIMSITTSISGCSK